MKKYLWMFGINVFLSTFTFGGGYIIVPMVQKYFVEKKKLFTEEELMEMAAVAQSTPGAIAINLISLAGLRVGGVGGLVVSAVGAVLPPLLILSLISSFYTLMISNVWIAAVLRGMQAGVAALIVDFVMNASLSIAKEKSWLLDAFVILSFLLAFFGQVNVIYILVASCLVSVLYALFEERRRKV